jgi:hypothetical protein
MRDFLATNARPSWAGDYFFWSIKLQSSVDIRSKPSGDASILRTLPKGSVLSIGRCKGTGSFFFPKEANLKMNKLQQQIDLAWCEVAVYPSQDIAGFALGSSLRLPKVRRAAATGRTARYRDDDRRSILGYVPKGTVIELRSCATNRAKPILVLGDWCFGYVESANRKPTPGWFDAGALKELSR